MARNTYLEEAASELPVLSEPYVVDEAQIQRYQDDGFIVLKNVLSAQEVDAYSSAISRDGHLHFSRADSEEAFDGLLQTLNFRFESSAMRHYALSRRIGSIGAQLSRARAVRIYHDQLLFKPAGGAASYWHQDQYFWPLETDQAIGTWMPLADVTAANGAMRYVRGSHHLGDLGQHCIDAASELYFEGIIRDHQLKAVQLDDIRAGDLCVHNGWTVHGAASNQSDRTREAMIVSMFPDGTRVGSENNKWKKSDRIKFLGGRKEGSIADSKLNTVLFDKGVG